MLQSAKKTVLLVEDSPAQAMAYRVLLEDAGLAVLWAENGFAGLSMAERHLPNAIILDVEMPDMNGVEVCRRLKEQPGTAHIPVVILTVRSEPGVLLDGFQMGAVDFIPKDPFAGPTLLETLRQLGVLNHHSVKFNGCL